jgi:hypothetical protein
MNSNPFPAVATRVDSPADPALASEEDLLAEMGLDSGGLEGLLHRVPAEPASIAETRIAEKELVNLLLKHLHVRGLETVSQLVPALGLGPHVVLQLLEAAVGLRLVAHGGLGGNGEMRFALLDAGRRWAIDALDQSQYLGPAPVTPEAFIAQLDLQQIAEQRVTWPRIKEALQGLTIADRLVRSIGPALNSGRCILLFGPPGNGKTSIATRIHRLFDDIVFVPHAISVDGQVIRVFDANLHEPIETPEDPDAMTKVVRRSYDRRWVPCRRPFIMTGGELTLDQLDLRYDRSVGFYEAPLPVKALGGCFVIDDFGRQTATPTQLLNRWIVPLENKFDFLKLHTGRTIRVPFDELVIFSTNRPPEELLDAAQLRRIPYKIEIPGPTRDEFRAIFEDLSQANGLVLTDETFERIVQVLTEKKQVKLAAYHASFIVSQMLAISRFMGAPPSFEWEFIEEAMENLRVADED